MKEIPLQCNACDDILIIPAVGESSACRCGRFSVTRDNANGYIVRAPMGDMGRALLRAVWMATDDPSIIAPGEPIEIEEVPSDD